MRLAAEGARAATWAVRTARSRACRSVTFPTLGAAERVERVVWRGRRAVGVQTVRRTLTANKAVLIAASAVQTPALLRRSGVRNRHLGRHFQGHPGMAG